jgi:DNA-binding transcriptional MerR regulator
VTYRAADIQNLLTTGDLCRRFGVSHEAVRRWVLQGALRSVGALSSGTRLFDPADVDAFAVVRAQRLATDDLTIISGPDEAEP